MKCEIKHTVHVCFFSEYHGTLAAESVFFSRYSVIIIYTHHSLLTLSYIPSTLQPMLGYQVHRKEGLAVILDNKIVG